MKMTADELNQKLQEHKQWLLNKTGKKLELMGVDLYGVDLRYADLRYADLRCVDLSCSNLFGADLRGADLSYSNLGYTYLNGVSLYRANLRSAYLHGTHLRGADLTCSDLQGADLRGVDLQGADLSGANLNNTQIDIPISCPTHGEFIAWKKIGYAIIKLKILEDSKRLSATTNKCRCDKALVLAIENIDGTSSGVTEIVNELYKPAITYKVGEIVYPDWFDENRWNECSHGIHFFVDRKSAELYY